MTVVDSDGLRHGGGEEIRAQARRRRTFAVISHPDAGKSTLTEALALHATAISEAGAVHGKAGRRGVTSDWMAMERNRGISITSAVLRFDYGDAVLNLLDTPGHADFSEDTYRVLEAVDCAIMLLDSAKGLEPQTLKLFDVVLHRLEHEFGALAELQHLGYTLARRTDAAGAAALRGERGSEVCTRRLDGAHLALFTDRWRLGSVRRAHPDVRLETLLADAE